MRASPRTCRLISASKRAEYAKVRQIQKQVEHLRRLVPNAPPRPHHASNIKVWTEYVRALVQMTIPS